MESAEENDLREITLLSLVDLSRRPSEIISRAAAWGEFAFLHKLPLIIGHGNRGGYADQKFLKCMEKYKPFVSVVSENCSDEYPNLSRLRNIGAGAVETKCMLLLDIDIYPDISLVRGMWRSLLKNDVRSIMAPCLYLTKKGSRQLLKTGDSAGLWEKYLDFYSGYFMHIAMPSSVILLHTEDFQKINGFDEDYKGHGFEDFDFMIRLWRANGWQEVTENDIDLHEAYRAPMLSHGFRGKLARLSIPATLDDVVAFHIHHLISGKEKYYQSRNDNLQIFKKKMSHICAKGGGGIFQQIQDNISNFFLACERKNKNPSRYERLFDATPAHMRDRYSLHRIFRQMKYIFSR